MYQPKRDAVDDLLLAPRAVLSAEFWTEVCGMFVVFSMGTILEAQWDSASKPSPLLVRETILAVSCRGVEWEAQYLLETEPQYRRFWIFHDPNG